MKAESHRLHRKILALRSFPGETFYELPRIYTTALTTSGVEVQYPSIMVTWPKSPEAALEEGVRLAERLNQERLGGQGKILGVRKSVEGEDYAIYMEVPLEIYKDLDLTEEIGVEVLKLSDRLGVPFFLYFVPPGYFG
ncbi:hypothetical protein [Thermus tengchongensis]|uniref:Uncharacterized protein n=1 Tax=Thermus tengchongensis TaxID=1214928 RepID=A0ABY2K3S5_9DEIN|nr:hypothetical protein [Thermus tengchongensis]TFU14695.1 hypothetical protein E0489_11790 [Thermus tengchongensis]